jgi:hypothetical protein
MTSNDSKIAKIQTNFQALSETASSLNSASNELTKVVGRLDEALKKLNVGLSAWVTFEDRLPHEDLQYDCDQIGYCKVEGKWGISIRHIWGDERWDTKNEDGPWLFNDAPREMRLRSVDEIPQLIESLSTKAANTAKKIQEKTKEVGELAAAIESANQAKRTALAERVAAARANVAAKATASPEAAIKQLIFKGIPNTTKEGSK